MIQKFMYLDIYVQNIMVILWYFLVLYFMQNIDLNINVMFFFIII